MINTNTTQTLYNTLNDSVFDLCNKVKRELKNKVVNYHLLRIYKEQGTIYIQITEIFAEQHKETLKQVVKLVYLYRQHFLPCKEGYKRYTREKEGYKRSSSFPIQLEITE